MITACTQAKTDDAVAGAINALMEADLLRRYVVDGRELFHVPRTRPHRHYIVRKYPPSPWDTDVKLGKTRRVEQRGLAKEHAKNQPLVGDVATTSLLDGDHVAEGVGVGVGVGKENIGRAASIRAQDGARSLGDNSGPTAAGMACLAMRKAGMAATNPGDPRLIELCAQGATADEFAGLAAEAVAKGKGFAWVLVALQSRRADAHAIALAPRVADVAASAESERSAKYLLDQAKHAAIAKAEAKARREQRKGEA
jgi:hypothetical protein